MNLNDIFSDMSKFGLGEVAAKQEVVFKEPAQKDTLERKAESHIDEDFNIKDYIFEKKFECPACEKETISNVVREKKIRIESVEFDLYLKCSPIDPLYYDVIICNNCGYAATKNSFGYLSERQQKLIAENITANFKPISYPDELTVEMAIERYKLALLNAVVKQAKNGERAYICTKLAWLYRICDDEESMKKFAALSITGFKKALTTESVPIMGLTDNTVLYLIGAFSKVVGDYEGAIKMLSGVVVSKSASERLKDRARDLKTEIIVMKTQS